MGMGKKDKAALREAAKHAKEDRKKEREIRNKHRKQKCKDVFKLSPAYVKFFNDFNNQLKATGLQLRDVGGDGNCLFRSISDQIEGDEALHEVYRRLACEHMRENEEFYTLYLDEDEDGNMTQYLRQMVKDGEWGGNLQLQALSECLNMNIQTIVEPWNEKKDKNQKRFTIHLAYFQQEQFQHYASVRILGDESNTPAIQSLSKLPKYKYLDFLGNNEFKYHKEQSEEQMLIRLQMQQLGVDYKGYEEEEYQQQQQQEQPFPNFPRNKRCKCGSKEPYKNCCYKQYEKRKAAKYSR